MSGWEAYVNALLGDGTVMTGAAIYGAADEETKTPCSLWAASSAHYIAQSEVQQLFDALKKQPKFDEMSSTGFKVGGVKYMKINSEVGAVIRGKQGENATVAALTKRAIIVATGKASPQEVSVAVERMAADLGSKGF